MNEIHKNKEEALQLPVENKKQLIIIIIMFIAGYFWIDFETFENKTFEIKMRCLCVMIIIITLIK